MPTKRVEFNGSNGQRLSGRLDLPEGPPRCVGLFAHCFTCSKESAAAATISRELSRQGIGVLRFDFTGLGESTGEFANTDFTSNIADLHDAARWLADELEPPQLLVGHSLGGAAALRAAADLPNVRAVSTIGAPATPSHVERLLRGSVAEIRDKGSAEVGIGGRSFRISRAFLDDLADYDRRDGLARLGAAKLLFHAVDDEVVALESASRLFAKLTHPKSFVALESADHLLTTRRDGEDVARILAAWVTRYV